MKEKKYQKWITMRLKCRYRQRKSCFVHLFLVWQNAKKLATFNQINIKNKEFYWNFHIWVLFCFVRFSFLFAVVWFFPSFCFLLIHLNKQSLLGLKFTILSEPLLTWKWIRLCWIQVNVMVWCHLTCLESD